MRRPRAPAIDRPTVVPPPPAARSPAQRRLVAERPITGVQPDRLISRRFPARIKSFPRAATSRGATHARARWRRRRRRRRCSPSSSSGTPSMWSTTTPTRWAHPARPGRPHPRAYAVRATGPADPPGAAMDCLGAAARPRSDVHCSTLAHRPAHSAKPEHRRREGDGACLAHPRCRPGGHCRIHRCATRPPRSVPNGWRHGPVVSSTGAGSLAFVNVVKSLEPFFNVVFGALLLPPDQASIATCPRQGGLGVQTAGSRHLSKRQ